VSWKKLHPILIGAGIAILLVVPLGAFAFIKSGLYNVAASHPHTRLTEWITHETMIHSVRRRAAGIAAPRGVAAREVAAGFCTYETHCVACHGAAGVAREPWVAGLEPAPPYLLDASEKFTPSELFWIAKNGIKMTGMPSWRDSLSDRELWGVVAWLEASRTLPPQTYRQWGARGMCAPTASPFPE
jgi:mono/diheme cytochrome c family protein